MAEISWRDEPTEEDYTSALAYLKLLIPVTGAERAVARFRDLEVSEHKAVDVLRAAGVSQQELLVDLAQEQSPPMLLAAPDPFAPLIIVSGYLTVYSVAAGDRDAVIPCKLLHLP